MYSLIRTNAPGILLALGLSVGASLHLSATALGFETMSGSDVTNSANQTDRILVAQADADSEGQPVSYTREQADRGEKRYQSDCAECHGSDLKGGLVGGPPLRGSAFEEKFANGAPASSMFLYMSNLMPPNAPGRFSDETYADIMAFILKGNGFQPGAPLPSNVDALDQLIVEK